MQYNAPYGVSDPNAAYINGDPSVGRAGSIPPAASIEFPQREIVNLISDANLFTPDNGDLQQLAKSIQSMLLISKDDAGTANAYQVTLTPAPAAYFKYMTVVCKILFTNTGPSVLNVNALGPKPIRHPSDNSELSGAELRANAIACFIFDGTYFHLVWSSSGVPGIPGAPIYLVQPRDLYVNWATGSDSAYDGQSAAVTAGTIHGPFQTPQRAATEINKWNLNGFGVTVHIADSASYPNFVLPAPGGSGSVSWIGNAATPGNVVVTGINKTAISGVACGTHYIQGLTVTSTGSTSGGDNLCGFNFGGACRITLYDINYSTCSGPMLVAAGAAAVGLYNKHTITGSSTGNPLSGGCFASAFLSGSIGVNGLALPTLNISQPVTIQTFVQANAAGQLDIKFASITGAANVTGTKFAVTTNAVINSEGGGINYYPGTVAGTYSAGGQYV